ncbi:MAG: Aquaporin Z [uncultured Solirubrobacteraceae bacterium]|uniref:Aquaporin Z n=1 Tax=uncultured Solirubrobacteraceae bacterium TaxID=1162706 RepID=A0A6J4TDD1_9ACTN|nr:MAG: Aquaporin Z [uncultured Solirubrobacteraceae bacterium]
MEASRRTAAYSGTGRTAHRDVERRGPEAYAAELIGTLMLVFFICAIVSLHHGASPTALGVTDWAVIGLVHFFLLAMLIHTLGGASGGHFNPAVTITFAALRKIGPVDAAIYIVLQIIGAILGALLVKLLLDNEGEAVGYGQPTISDTRLESKMLPGFFAELIGTFALMWAIMGVAVNPKGARDWAGITIGGTLGFAVLVFGPLTGAGLNPARALGPSLFGDDSAPVGDFIVAYVLGPTVGALLAGMLYTALILRPDGMGDGRREIDTLSGRAESRRDGGNVDYDETGDRLGKDDDHDVRRGDDERRDDTGTGTTGNTL